MAPQENINNFNFVAGARRVVLLHVFGNPSSEFTKNMGILHQRNHEKAGYDVEGLDLQHHYALIHPGALWSFPADLTDQALEAAPKMTMSKAVEVVTGLGVDVAAVHVHTTVSNYKTLFELLDIPFIGTGGEAAANVADKATTRALLLQAGVKVPHGTVLHKTAFNSQQFSLSNLLEQHSLDYPLVVKPTRMEASVGVHLVHSKEDMMSALKVVFGLGDVAIIDEFIRGREMRTGVLCVDEGQLQSLPMMEYNISHDDIRGMNMKVERDGKKLVNNAFQFLHKQDNPQLYDNMFRVAAACHQALNCRDFSFMDCRVTEEGEIFVLEINVFAAFNPGSVMTKLTTAAGISHSQFWSSMLRRALSRRQQTVSKIQGA